MIETCAGAVRLKVRTSPPLTFFTATSVIRRPGGTGFDARFLRCLLRFGLGFGWSLVIVVEPALWLVAVVPGSAVPVSGAGSADGCDDPPSGMRPPPVPPPLPGSPLPPPSPEPASMTTGAGAYCAIVPDSPAAQMSSAPAIETALSG